MCSHISNYIGKKLTYSICTLDTKKRKTQRCILAIALWFSTFSISFIFQFFFISLHCEIKRAFLFYNLAHRAIFIGIKNNAQQSLLILPMLNFFRVLKDFLVLAFECDLSLGKSDFLVLVLAWIKSCQSVSENDLDCKT